MRPMATLTVRPSVRRPDNPTSVATPRVALAIDEFLEGIPPALLMRYLRCAPKTGLRKRL
jgi:hypothetical protein